MKRLFYSTVLTLAIATTGSFITACSSPQNQGQAPSGIAVEGSGGMEGVNHGHGMNHGSGMNHSMAMDLGPADAEYDLRFIDAMTLHHQGAVDMAKEAQQKSQRSEIKQLAGDITKAQNKEINQLTQWRKAWYPQAANEPVAYGTTGKSTITMPEEQRQDMAMAEDLGTTDAQFDLRFINAMIPHHEGAVTMAKDALNKTKRPEIKQLAQDIVTSQQAEVTQMKQWRQAWYKQ